MKSFIRHFSNVAAAVCAYLGFIEGYEFAIEVTTIYIWACFAVSIFVCLVIHLFRALNDLFEHKKATGDADEAMIQKHANATRNILSMADRVRGIMWMEIVFDSPVIVMAIIGGFYYSAIAFTVQLLSAFYIGTITRRNIFP